MTQPAQPRGPGRPPKLQACLKCKHELPQRSFVGSKSGICVTCRREIRNETGRPATQDPVFAAEGQYARPMKAETHDSVTDIVRLQAVGASMAQLLATVGLPERCECCWETRHVRRDGYGGVALVCRRCEFQIVQVGCCHLHPGGRVFYPELGEGRPTTPVEEPMEITLLFAVAPSAPRPRRDMPDQPETVPSEPDL